MAGFVYVMSNPAMPGLVKIGKSDKDPSGDRARELRTTGVPYPFKVEYFAFVEGHHELEKTLHSFFAKHRVDKDREFFRISPDVVIEAIKSRVKVLYEKDEYSYGDNRKKEQQERDSLRLKQEEIRKKKRDKLLSELRDKHEKSSGYDSRKNSNDYSYLDLEMRKAIDNNDIELIKELISFGINLYPAYMDMSHVVYVNHHGSKEAVELILNASKQKI